MTDSDYPWEVIPDPNAGGYVIRFPDLPGCMSQVENLYHINSTAAEIRDLWLATAREAGMAIPEPGSHEANVRRLRKLERACKRLFWRTEHGERYMPAQSLHGTNEREAIATIGRLLEPSPTVADVIGIAPDMTGGMSSEAYVRQIRDTQEAERE